MVDTQSSSECLTSKAQFYRRYRPPLPKALLNHVRGRAKNGSLLDVGCGPGRVAVVLAPHFREVVAVDPDADMIDEGRKHALEAGASNICWHAGRAEQFSSPRGKFDLITFGDSFHRLDQDRVLDQTRRWLADAGGVAILQSWDTLSGTEPWHRVVAGIVEQYSGRPTFSYEPASCERYAAALRRHGFSQVETVSFSEPYLWSAGSVVGNLHSTGYCARAALGARSEEFVEQVTRALQAFEINGALPEILHFSYTFGRLGQTELRA